MIRPEMQPVATSVRCVAPVGAVLGEGPLYDPRIGKLLFLDIKGEKIFAYDPQTEKTTTFAVSGNISALGLRRKGGYICAHRRGFAWLQIVDGVVDLTQLSDPEFDRPGNRFNDGKVDPFGGFWAGTMDDSEKDPGAGSWWRLDADGRAICCARGFHVTNGPAFDPQRSRVYFTDSARQTVFEADVERDAIHSRRVFLQFGEGDGYPDGMEVDRHGDLWIAFWDGGAVRKFSAEGKLLGEAPVPAPRPTSVAIVGDRLFVTSARTGLAAEALARFPQSGGLFEFALPGLLESQPRYFDG